MINQSFQQEQDSKTLIALIARVADHRDEDAFSMLFDHFAPRIKSFGLAFKPDAGISADELVQEVMLKIWMKAHQYQEEKASPTTWVYTLARNARIDHYRKTQRHSESLDAEEIYLNFPDEAPGPFMAAQRKQTEKKVANALNTLPVDQNRVLSKVYMEGKTHHQIADELELPLGTVKSRIRLALGKLGILLENDL